MLVTVRPTRSRSLAEYSLCLHWASGFAKRRVHRATESSRVYRRESIQLRLDAPEIVAHACGVDEPPIQHRPHVNKIQGMATLRLRQRLRIEVEMEKPETSMLRHERPAIFPARGNRNEVGRRRQFDIHAQ